MPKGKGYPKSTKKAGTKKQGKSATAGRAVRNAAAKRRQSGSTARG